jgi:probable selenium-dependent hydroxylase accessory protein YqeC
LNDQPRTSIPSLPEALGATKGVVCFVGAGGKKTTMYALARAHSGRVLLSSTSHMYRYRNDEVDKIVMLEDSYAGLPELRDHKVVAVATTTETKNRVGGLTADRIQTIYREGGFDVCFIKSDGARSRWIKTPGEHEPLISSFASTVIPVVSAQVLDRQLNDDIAHRPERIAQLLGMQLHDCITDSHLIDLLSNPNGALKNIGDAEVIPLINMVDNQALLLRAREIARAALQRSTRISRIVLGSMKDARIVEVVTRASHS